MTTDTERREEAHREDAAAFAAEHRVASDEGSLLGNAVLFYPDGTEAKTPEELTDGWRVAYVLRADPTNDPFVDLFTPIPVVNDEGAESTLVSRVPRAGSGSAGPGAWAPLAMPVDGHPLYPES